MKAFTPLDLLALFAVSAIWGVNNVFAKIAVDAIPPMLVLSIRFGLVVLLLLPFLKPPSGGWRALIWVALLTGPLHFGLQYLGLALAHDLGPMVIGMQLWIPSSVVFASLLLRERAGPWRIAGVAAAFAGIVALAADPVVFAQLGALGLVGLAAFAYGAGAVMVRRGPKLHPLSYQAWISLLSLPVLIPASAAFESGRWGAALHAGWLPWAAILFGVLAANIVASALMFMLVQKYEVSRTTPFLFLSPLLSIALGILILGDPVTGQIAVGGALTLLGVALTAMAERRFTPPPATEEP